VVGSLAVTFSHSSPFQCYLLLFALSDWRLFHSASRTSYTVAICHASHRFPGILLGPLNTSNGNTVPSGSMCYQISIDTMSHHRRTGTSFTPLQNRKNLDGGTSYFAKVGLVRDGCNSAQCYNGGGAEFIHHIEVRHSYDCSHGEGVKLIVLVSFS